ncbi:cold-shock protein [Flavobacterium columnare]|uniref:ColD-shock DNA-binding protein family n=2 Tax=Flavobacterium columnare TaxID=996 RepID=G8XBA3_FLACA|nr:cold shock domain-containing protein [Flavobacterium columnare]AEW86071.1 colD-shock DNA-binding protein family [Flavobacterium columnare ATCC 49512]AMO19176.1 cold shock domain-containing protein [Flavobacterium columnare]ANO48118.1 colD-shock DNA-binding protein family [Flavobacterium columnare]APT21311.1 cold-shock protein [Flavobacterium columnare]AUX17112.1 cold-shock protein [Flavobacterium columnare]
MADSYSKKENNKKKVKKQQDKALRRNERKVNNNKGKTLEEMFVYVDKNGKLTSVPPHLQTVETDKNSENINKNTGEIRKDFSTGLITFIKETGFGFITEDETRDNLLFHFEASNTKFKRNVRVSFKKEVTPKGFRATHLIIIN